MSTVLEPREQTFPLYLRMVSDGVFSVIGNISGSMAMMVCSSQRNEILCPLARHHLLQWGGVHYEHGTAVPVKHLSVEYSTDPRRPGKMPYALAIEA